MSTETESATVDDTTRPNRALPDLKSLLFGYPAIVLTIFVIVPALLLVVVSLFRNVEGAFYEPALTLENYARLVGSDLYRGRIVYTLGLSAFTAFACLVLGYPLAYYIATLESERLRRRYLSVIVSSLFLTFIVRAFAWQVLLESDSIVPMLGAAVGLLEEPSSLVPSTFALFVGMVYVFLPFMVVTLYLTLRNLDQSLREASRTLGAGPVTTFRRVTLPLSLNGIISGLLLVFTLSLGVYVLPRILANPPEWTIAVLVGELVGVEGNVPFGAAISVVILCIVGTILAIGWLLMERTGVTEQ